MSQQSHQDIKWIEFYQRMGKGEIPYNASSYYIANTSQEGSSAPSIKLVTPTEQQIEMAKSQVKKQNTKKRKKQKPRKKRVKKRVKKIKKRKTYKRRR